MSEQQAQGKPGNAEEEAFALINSRIENGRVELAQQSPNCKIYSQISTNVNTMESSSEHHNSSHKYPKWIYIYHITEKRNKMRVVTYKYKNETRMDKKEFETVIDDIYSSLSSGWEYEGLKRDKVPNFEGMNWNRRCYIAFLVEKTKWRFVGGATGHAPLQFVVQDERGYTYYDNNSFFDGAVLDAGSDGQVAYVIDQHKEPVFFDPSSNQKRPNFRFDIFLLKKLYDKANKQSQEKILIIDPPGDHKGPPWGDDS